MGIVYEAVDARLQRVVAIKVLPSEFAADEKRKKRFMVEAQAASSLNHPNICTIYEIDEVDGILFIAMEYIEGKTLSDEIAAGVLSIDRAMDISIQVAGALDKTHQRNIVHRDIKPSNIIIDPEGHVKILDFGLARQIQAVRPNTSSEAPTGALSLTETGSVAGTVGYMSPEQISGKEVDGRTDQFSFAVVMFEMLSGKLPFAGKTIFEVASSILKDEPIPISRFNPEVPLELEAILLKAMSKNANERYPTTHDMLIHLRKVRGDSLHSGETVFPPKSRSWPLAVLGIAVVLLAVLVFRTAGRYKPNAGPISAPAGHPIAIGEKHLAVLPFTNLGNAPESQAFCDGIVETLTSRLTELENTQRSVWIVPASEVRAAHVTSVAEAHKTFGVPLVVTGSVQRGTDDIRLTINIVDGKTLRQIRATSLRAGLGDVSSLQEDVVRKVAEMLDVPVVPVANSGGTSDPAAYDYYLQARGSLQRYEKMESLQSAIALFEQALAQDSTYALAYAGLGEAYWREFDLTKDARWVEYAKQNCARAIGLNNRLAPVHTTLGVLYNGTGHYEDAIREFQEAIRLNPRSSDAYRELAVAYEESGKWEEAEATHKKAIQLWPAYWAGYNRLGFFYYQRGRYSEAEKMFHRVVDLTPDNTRGYSNLGALYHLMGRYQEATRMLERSVTLEPNSDGYTNLGTLYFFLGRYADAVPVMEKAAQLAPSEFLPWGNLADAYRWAPGMTGKAAPAYRKAIELAETQLAVNPNDFQIRASIAVYQAKLGNRDPALKEISRALKQASGNVNVLFKSAIVFELCGDRALALRQLDAAMKGGYSVQEVEGEPEFARLRMDPLYSRLLPKKK